MNFVFPFGYKVTMLIMENIRQTLEIIHKITRINSVKQTNKKHSGLLYFF